MEDGVVHRFASDRPRVRPAGKASGMTSHASRPSTARRLHLRLVEPGRHSNASAIGRRRDREDRIARLRTYAALRPARPVFSHWSAAIVHELPILGRLPSTIHILSRSEVERAGRGIVTHARRAETQVRERRGLLVTSAAQTVADIAAATSVVGGVVMADAAIACGPFQERAALATRGDLLSCAASLPDDDARHRAVAVAAFADGRAESPLESASRICMALAGAPAPELQAPVEDLLGFRARVDFAWPELCLVGEADGSGKYVDPRHTRGRTSAEVLQRQRDRERLIRASGLRVVRWGWGTGTRPDRMRTALQKAGVPMSDRCTIPGLDLPAVGLPDDMHATSSL